MFKNKFFIMSIKKYQDFKERFDEFENQEDLEIGTQIQSEHKPTYDLIKKYFDENGKLPPEEFVYKSIASDHIEEIEDYYNSSTGLPNWEKEMKRTEDETGRKYDEEGANLIVQDINEKIIRFDNFLNEKECGTGSSVKVRHSKDRKGPNDSATCHKVGTEMEGQDGNIWVVESDKNSINHWKRK